MFICAISSILVATYLPKFVSVTHCYATFAFGSGKELCVTQTRVQSNYVLHILLTQIPSLVLLCLLNPRDSEISVTQGLVVHALSIIAFMVNLHLTFATY